MIAQNTLSACRSVLGRLFAGEAAPATLRRCH
jgi:hypothetical protein